MAQPTTAATNREDFTKIYWVEAFSAIIEIPTLDKDKFYYYARVLVSHTLVNDVLKDQQLNDPSYQTKKIDEFYEFYRETKPRWNSLLTSVFMKTLVDIDSSKMKLSPIDRDYVENIALEAALKAKNFTYLLGDADRKTWMVKYMFAKTPPEVIVGNVKLYEGLGLEKYKYFVNLELSISAGPKCVPEGTTDIFTEGWYTLYGKSQFPLERVVLLKKTMEEPSMLNPNIDPLIGLIYFKYRLVQESLPQDLRQTYWSTKISNISSFISQVSKTDKIAAQSK